MRKDKFYNRRQKSLSLVLIEKLVQLLWYIFWVVLLIKQKARPARQPG
jgi:hypothetical protein